MKIRTTLLTAAFIFLVSYAQADTTFETANAAYQKADYGKAAVAYEAVLKASGPSAALYYNMGNTYFRLGKKGLALLYYEKAKRFLPRDKDLLWNEALLQSQLTDRIVPKENPFMALLLEKIRFFNPSETAFVLLVLLGVLAGIQAIRFFKGGLGVGLKIVRLLLILSVAALMAVFYFQDKEFGKTKLVVLDSQASVRFGPSEKEAQAFQLHEGAAGSVLDETERWYFIWLANGQGGWVKKESGQIV